MDNEHIPETNAERFETFESDPTISFDREELTGLARSVTRTRHRRQLLAAGAATLAAVALLIGCLPNDPKQQESPTVAVDGVGAAAELVGVDVADAAEPAGDAMDDSDAMEDGVDEPSPFPGDSDSPQPQPDPDPDPGDDGGSDSDELDPVPPPEPQPCDALPADGSSLLVGPDPLVLADGQYEGSLTIRNCSDGDVDWTGSTKPSVALATAADTVLPGEVDDLSFVIDDEAWEAGAIDFKIKVYEDGHSHYVDVHAFRPTLGKDAVADVDLTAGAGAGGCADQCIRKALLRQNLTSPNLSLDVETTTEATVRVWVSTHAPVVADGVPEFPGVSSIDTSPVGVTEWTADLSPLDASTKYFIIVSATDINEHTAYRTGSFTTIEPIDTGGDLQVPGDSAGCSVQCITSALLTPGDDYSQRHLSMTTHTPAMMQMSASTDAPMYDDGVPSFEHSDAWANSGLEYTTEWETTLTDLAGDTTYHVIARATDAEGRTSYRVGQIHTAAAPTYDVLFSVVSIHVLYDGDKGGNDGELSFRWRVGDTEAGTRGEQDIAAGSTVAFPAAASDFWVADVGGFLPTVYVAGFERDPDGLVEFNTCPAGTPDSDGWNETCDSKWNVASSGLVSVDSVDGLPLCTDLGASESWAGLRCMQLDTPEVNGGYPTFSVLVAVQAS
jgi:hypothetical protein